MNVFGKDWNIFIVEDIADNINILQLIIEHNLRNRQARFTASGAMLFKWLDDSTTTTLNPKLRNIDLILLDLALPRESGYEVLKKIRKHPALQKTKVVAVTSSVSAADIDKMQAAGFDGFLGKPVNAAAFPANIKKVMEGEAVWSVY